jgi:DNA-binding NtrC family response regulator
MVSKICIVDHDPASRGYLRECVERGGHQVVTLDSGHQIKPRLSKKHLNILILNMDSPGVKEKGLSVQALRWGVGETHSEPNMVHRRHECPK